MSYLEALRANIEDGTAWNKFYENRPANMDRTIDEIINAMSVVELLEAIDAIDQERAAA